MRISNNFETERHKNTDWNNVKFPCHGRCIQDDRDYVVLFIDNRIGIVVEESHNSATFRYCVGYVSSSWNMDSFNLMPSGSATKFTTEY